MTRELVPPSIVPLTPPQHRTLTFIIVGMNNPGAMTAEALHPALTAHGTAAASDLAVLEYGTKPIGIYELQDMVRRYIEVGDYRHVRFVAASIGTLIVVEFLREHPRTRNRDNLRILAPVLIDPVTRWRDTKISVPGLGALPGSVAASVLRAAPSPRRLERLINQHNERGARKGIRPEPQVSKEAIDRFYAHLFGFTPLRSQLAALAAIADSPGVRPGEFDLPACLVLSERDQLLWPSAAASMRRAFRNPCVFRAPGTTHVSIIEHPRAWNEAIGRALEAARRHDLAARR